MSNVKKSPEAYGLSGEYQVFETERLTVVLLSPIQVQNLLTVLLQDDALASRLPWMEGESPGRALQEAFGIHLQCAAGQAKVWGIIERDRRMQIGAIVARDSLEGLDVEILVASQFWGQGVADEAGEPVMEWLAENYEVNLSLK